MNLFTVNIKGNWLDWMPTILSLLTILLSGLIHYTTQKQRKIDQKREEDRIFLQELKEYFKFYVRPSIQSFLNENSQNPCRYIDNQNNTLNSIYHTLATICDFLWYNRRKETFIFMKTTILILYVFEICKKCSEYLDKHKDSFNKIYIHSLVFFVSKELSFTIESLELILFSGNIVTIDNEIERIKEKANEFLFDKLPEFEKIEFPQKLLENKKCKFEELLKKEKCKL